MKKKARVFLALTLGIIALFTADARGYTVASRDSVADGVIFTMSNNARMKVQVCTDKIIRIVYTMRTTIPRADSNYIVVKGTWTPVPWSLSQSGTAYSVQTATVRADVAIASGTVSFYAVGTLILQETAGKTLTAVSISGQNAYQGTIDFNSVSNEGIYGFGQFQNGYFNQRGNSLELVQRNQTDCSPVFLSTRGFGIVWNNYSRMTVSPPLRLTCDWATNDAIDYYFMYGPDFDRIIASYRTITGPAPLWPKWAYGYWQCRNRYSDQYSILHYAIDSFRVKNYPVDNVVQDWLYYPDGMNGSNSFDRTRYPDPKGMIDSLHNQLNCHFTISIWPSFKDNPANSNWAFMSSRGYLLSIYDFLGQTYDAFNDSAAYYYWKFIEDSLVTIGVDAFWPDATEPESYGWENCNTAQGPAAKVLNIYPLLHSKTLHDGFRKATGGSKRVCNLTRSYYAGSQRLAAAYWTGDVQTDLATYVTQIPAGLNVCATGLPYFCTDIGGFNGTNDPYVLLRWFQWGAFNPVFRIHGSRATELYWEPQKTVEAILVKYLRLRYRLFPYVYSCAWKVTDEGYTIMRGLPFDFRSDLNVRDRTDEFMFGPAFLICPVTSTSATTRSVYLPAGKWHNFWTGDTNSGAAGRTITAQSPNDIMPIYVRAGSIVPLGPVINYADTAADPIELRVYTGADGSFTLYEDEGDNYNYEQGIYATIPIAWNEAAQILSIGPTFGSFPGMLTNRTFNVVWVRQSHGTGGEVTAMTDSTDKVLTYTGGVLNLDKTTGQIGVITRPPALRSGAFSFRLIGRRLIVSGTGKNPLKISLINPLGRVIAAKNIQSGTLVALADHLASGVYIVQCREGSVLLQRKAYVIP